MYLLYKEACSEKDIVPVASGWVYRKVFNESYNLHFGRSVYYSSSLVHCLSLYVFFFIYDFCYSMYNMYGFVSYRPKSDTCKSCDTFKMKVDAEKDPEEVARLNARWELHKRKADRAYSQLKEDTALSQLDLDIDMITFDLQQSLPTPLLSTSVVFYKRQLWTYNLGIHCCSTGEGFMHVWDESIASRGSQEVGTCIVKHIKEIASGATRLVLYSDACGGQNRNINIVALWLYITASKDFSYEVVDHKFMISGHSYLPNDRDFGSIESARRRTQHVFVPEDWRTLIRNARRKNAFSVREMKNEDFLAIGDFTKFIVNRKTNKDGEKVNWLKILWIRVEKSAPLSYKYRCSHNELEQWKIVNLKPMHQGRPIDIGRASLQQLYHGPRSINKKKLDDLIQMLDFIPPVYHGFYQKLNQSIADSDEDDDLDEDQEEED